MSKSTSGLQSLAAMAHVLAATDGLDDLLEVAAEHACEALGAATVSISKLLPGGASVRTLINVGDLAPHEERLPLDEVYEIADDAGLLAAIEGRTSWVECIDDEDRVPGKNALLETLGKGCSLATPILVDGDVWGEFYVTRHVGVDRFDDDGVAYAEVLAAILGAAVSRAIHEEALAVMAFHDPLTGLLNRRALDEHAARLFDLGDESRRAVAVVAIDINGLKKVNDTEGHTRGDQAIRAVAAALQSAFDVHPSSAVARVGGDEFVTLVSGRDVDMVEQTVNVLCRTVAEKSTRVSLSAGIAATVLVPGATATMQSLFIAADNALYAAKRSGSPTAVVAEEPAVGPVVA